MLLSFTLIVLVYFISLAPANSIIKNKYTSNFVILFTILIISCFTYFTQSLGTDMPIYLNNFFQLHNVSLGNALNTSGFEVGYTMFVWLIAQLTSSPDLFRVVIWLTIGLLILFSTKKIFNSYKLLYVYFCFIAFFVTNSLVTNILRQGIAISLLLYSMAVLIGDKRNKIKFYIPLLLAPLFHNTSIIFSIIIFLIRRFRISINISITMWGAALILFLTGINSTILSLFGNLISNYSAYTNQSLIESYGGVNKLDFLVFGAFFLLFGIIMYKKFMEYNEKYELILIIYTLFNTVFLLLGFIAYSDRVAIYSWFLIPLVVLYPILESNSMIFKKYRTILVVIVITLLIIISYILSSSLIIY